MSACPCTPGVLPSGRGLGKQYVDCCGRLHSGAENATTAAGLMRSRYSAYVLGHEPYLLATWHDSTRPSSLNLAKTMDTKSKGLEVKS